ncbi:hypothetical protein ACFLWU_05115 [Chloroflexota bacterium]
MDQVNVFTGASTRHNRALNEVRDMAETVQGFLTTYNLYGNADLKSLFENIGDAKFDLTAIAYRCRLLIKTSTSIKSGKVSIGVNELFDSIENLRRIMSNPALLDTKLEEAVLGLRVSFEKMQDALSDIEFK